MIDYTLILSKKYVGEEWTLNGDDYDGLVWLSDSPQPSKDELDNQWEGVLAEIEAEKLAKENQRKAILDRLGLTEDEAKLILG